MGLGSGLGLGLVRTDFSVQINARVNMPSGVQKVIVYDSFYE